MHHAGENSIPVQGSVLFGTVNGAVGEDISYNQTFSVLFFFYIGFTINTLANKVHVS